MAQILVSQHDGALLPSLRAEELPIDIDVQGAAPCKKPGSLHLLRDVPYAQKLKQEIPDCLATVCRMMQSQEFIALPEADQDHVEKYTADWMLAFGMDQWAAWHCEEGCSRRIVATGWEPHAC
ncbi:unnamed protein product [Cladocopium goreaui]|uniref:Uncharacterized protein n=1 Tax=Cladocopium goreaui TaxID=2562237 RepID=A0A9P1D2M7_9DINO|nr:unnamed protein product [Cladocopium goreaui]